ncbi:unnamed protein product [Prunus armeniaca]|uniref:Uncharacterized protein n=1 Tax=Prunus armeniaca TaxID=36596 RepID=A0A6J5VFE6_PRUAR|nr:unnamed protein product [Prunus armeniaca]
MDSGIVSRAVSLQVRRTVISIGPGDLSLNASSKTADEYAFQDALGKSLELNFQDCSSRLSCVLPKL